MIGRIETPKKLQINKKNTIIHFHIKKDVLLQCKVLINHSVDNERDI